MSSTPDLEAPKGLVAGKYRLSRLLGKGGMGAVWEGVHGELGTRVAVKFIDTEYASSEDVRQRFVNEAKAAARLRSKHVVQVYDQGVADDGRPYIVMEFLSGEPLDARLDRLGRLPPLETAKMVLHVSRALAKAHESNVVHRDLKPENVFLVHDDEDQTDIAKVVDFGIAKFTDASKPGSSSTRTGAVLGTPQYMSPEQARGLRSVDHRTDLWSLGVIAYRCLVGVLPFKGEAMGDLLVNICTADPPVPSSIAADVPAGFDAWARRALAREPSQRFQTAAELCDSFAQICGLEARLGPASSGTRVEWAPPAGGAGRAVTEGPFATTNLSVPGVGSRRPSIGLLAVLFVAALVVAAVVARSVMRASGEPPARAAVRSPASAPLAPTSALEPPAPEVTPVTSARADVSNPNPPATAAEKRVPVAPRAPARAGVPREKAKPETPAPPPAKPPGQKDRLGY